MADEDDELFACDHCGEEFATLAALEGHEAEGCWAEPSGDEEDEDDV